MRYLDASERHQLAGDYYAPEGLYEYTKSLPFLGTVTSDVTSLVAGEWTEIVIKYEVGASGLADGAWIKGTFKFYSDWALFQTSNQTKDNYVSAEYEPNALRPGQTPATVQSLGVRFDQKGHERPFQKAVIIDIQDGYMNPGDLIIIRLGDRRFGGRGTRVQTFVESDFRWRFYIDPVGTSRFASIKPDLSWDIIAGAPQKVAVVSPRLLQPHALFAIHAHTEDSWGNVNRTADLRFELDIRREEESSKPLPIIHKLVAGPRTEWTSVVFDSLAISVKGDYIFHVRVTSEDKTINLVKHSYLTVSPDLKVPKILYGDLHVHSDDTVGTHSSTYNFSYGREIAGLDILGYTANDFQITKERWDATTQLIQSLNKPGKFVIFPGTEWCGNSAAGGDHNVVFLADPATNPAEFPLDRDGNIARSFEWSEDGPKDLIPGTWPLDEVYSIYARNTTDHLLIPHVGGRRCNLGWHHPQLERLVEIGSAWGQFEWLLRDAVARGWKMGVTANSDEHRGRCGGGVPGTAVFGTRGGLTGVLSSKLERSEVASALRARHTFATTGQRLVGLVNVKGSDTVQGDEIEHIVGQPLELAYHFLGEKGFSSIEAFDASGQIWSRNFWSESGSESHPPPPPTILRVTWGGARLYDRYREAIWDGKIEIQNSTIQTISPFGGLSDNPEDQVKQSNLHTVTFSSRTSGDLDGVNIKLNSDISTVSVSISGTLGGYVKVGDPLAGNPHKAQPFFLLQANWEDISAPGGKVLDIKGGCELFVRVEAVPDIDLPRRVEGSVCFHGGKDEERAIYFVGREWSGEKVVTSPLFVRFV